MCMWGGTVYSISFSIIIIQDTPKHFFGGSANVREVFELNCVEPRAKKK